MSDDSDHYVLFLGPPPATFELEEKRGNAYDPPFLLGTVGHGQIPRRWRNFLSRGFLSKVTGWPGLIICGQIILQTGAWSFFALLQSRRGIPLPYAWAVVVDENPHIVDWVTTLVATFLAFLTTSLFSSAIRKSTAVHLHGDGMSLAAFIASIKISTCSPILDRDSGRRKLSFMSIVIFLLAGGVQTAGWKALITPYSIDAHVPLTGSEIDLSSPALAELQDSDGLNLCVKAGTSELAFVVGQTDSGYAAVKGDLGVPATFTMMDQTVNISTAGILPLTLEARNSSTWFVNTTTIPTSIRSTASLPPGLSSWYSLTQQGFTADVSCNYRDQEDATVLPILLSNTEVKLDWNNASLIKSMTLSDMYAACQVDDRVPLLNRSGAYTVGDQPNYLLMIACPSKDNYKLIFNADPDGLYGFLSTTECVLMPKITSVEVTYTNFINTVTSPISTLADPAGPPTLAAVATLYNSVFFSQSIASNGVGDRLRSLIAEKSGSFLYTGEATMRVTEEYIRGVTEYSASVFRACLFANQTFLDTLPSRMNVSTEGTFHSNTVGWIHASPLTLLELIPGLLMAIFTIYAVITTLAYQDVDRRYEPFDPSDPMHLVAASASGHLNNVFMGTRKDNFAAAAEASVYLRDIRGRGPALICSG